jgi:glycosyltransferase involved in cell wall biosynthesis
MYERLAPILDTLPASWEMIFVDDGSRDGTDRELQRLARADHRVKIVTFRRNYGQTAAMSAGIRHATGDTVVLLDGDLQNDPTDIPRMLEKLSEGYDLVHGWRKERHDRFLDRRLPSMIANWIISRVTGFPVHDLGCTLKVIRTEIAQELNLYGEMHRFIPILAHHRGARCVEVVTRHHARQFGTSKYGISRTFRVMFDLLTVQFITQYLASPMKYFGRLGLGCFGIGALAGVATLAMKCWQQTDMTGNPLLLCCVSAGLLGMQFLSLGLLGELLSRIYFASQDRANYTIRKRTNLHEGAADERDSKPLSAAA